MNLGFDQDDLSLYSAPLIAFFILIEIVVGTVRKKPLYKTGETATNLYLTTFAIGVNLLLRGFYVWIYGVFYAFRVFDITDPWVYWISLLVIQDFLFYWLHLVDHYSRVFWAVHVTHHNSTDFNFSTGFRSSVFQPLYRFLYYIPLAFIGFRPLDIMFMYSAVQIWGIFIHTRMIGKLPAVIEFILVTPSHHRVHHGSNPLYLDKNMGMFLIIWDRIFGTFQEELDAEPVEYGLTTNPQNRGPVNIVFHEFKAILSDVRKTKGIHNKLKYIFKPPGWSPDGSTKTSSQLRIEKYGTDNPRLTNKLAK